MYKISNVHQRDTWTGRDGATNYDLFVTLHDGRSAIVTAKTPDRWKAGDEVVIKSERPGRYGNKWSLDKAGYENGPSQAPTTAAGGSGQNQSANIEAAWAIQTAVQMASAGASVPGVIAIAEKLHAAKLEMAARIAAGTLNQPEPEPQPQHDDEPPY